MAAHFEIRYAPKETRPDEPILVGRQQSQARIGIAEAKRLQIELAEAITQAEQAAEFS